MRHAACDELAAEGIQHLMAAELSAKRWFRMQVAGGLDRLLEKPV